MGEETTASKILAIVVGTVAILAIMAFATNALTDNTSNKVILSIDTAPTAPAPVPVDSAPLQPSHTLTSA